MNQNPEDTEILRRRKKRIIDGALEAFIAQGIKAVTMDNVATMLAISKRTLYEQFPSKEALLTACLLNHQQQEQEDISRYAAGEKNVLEIILFFYRRKLEQLASVSPRFFEDMKKYPRVLECLHQKRLLDSEKTTRFLYKGVEQGWFRAEINYEMLHFVIVNSFDCLLVNPSSKYTPLETTAVLLIWLRGICTEKGGQLLGEFLLGQEANKND